MNPIILQGADGAGGVWPDDEETRGGHHPQKSPENPRPDSKWRQPVRQEQLKGQNFADDPVNPFSIRPSQYESIPVHLILMKETRSSIQSVCQGHLWTALKLLGWLCESVSIYVQRKNFYDDCESVSIRPSQYESIPVRPSNPHERYSEFNSVSLPRASLNMHYRAKTLGWLCESVSIRPSQYESIHVITFQSSRIQFNSSSRASTVQVL